MANKSTMTYIKVAAKFMRENPNLKHYEAINKAKLIFKEKSSQTAI